jgi:predicted component of type VI protein secretion system
MSEHQRTSTYLVIRLGDEPERAVVWDTLDIAVGRHDSQDISVADPEVSREHAIFRREGERFCVKDLGTGLGTVVNGEPIATHFLEHGDVVRIGMIEIRFGQTEQPIRPGPNVCFASELKQRGLPAACGAAGGRTMLAFDVDEEPAFAAPTVPQLETRARAVTADGSLEELDDLDPLGLSIDGADLGAGAPARDLDQELLADLPDPRGSSAPTRGPGEPAAEPPTRESAACVEAPNPAAQHVAAESAVSDGGATKTVVTLSLEIDGPSQQVETFVSSVRGKRIQFGSVSLEIRDA